MNSETAFDPANASVFVIFALSSVSSFLTALVLFAVLG